MVDNQVRYNLESDMKKVYAELDELDHHVEFSKTHKLDVVRVINKDICNFLLWLCSTSESINWKDAEVISWINLIELTPNELTRYIERRKPYQKEGTPEIPLSLSWILDLPDKHYDMAKKVSKSVVESFKTWGELILNRQDVDDKKKTELFRQYINELENAWSHTFEIEKWLRVDDKFLFPEFPEFPDFDWDEWDEE